MMAAAVEVAEAAVEGVEADGLEGEVAEWTVCAEAEATVEEGTDG